MASIFTRIIRGEIPSYRIGETERCLVFLDAFPLRRGHALVVPKTEVDLITDLDDVTYDELMRVTRRTASAIKKAIPCNRCSIQVIGLEVPHAHVHVIPINTPFDCNFSNPKLSFTKEEFEATAALIKKEFDQLAR